MKKLLFLEVSILSIVLFLSMLGVSSSNAAAPTDEKRIVSIDGSITEIIYALNKQQYLVGIDTTSRYPAATADITKVGYMRQLSAEGILSLNPSLVIASEGAGPKAVLDQLRNAGLAVEIIRSDTTIAGVVNKINIVAKLLDAEREAKQLTEQLTLNVNKLSQDLADNQWESPPKVMFLLAAGSHGVMLSGKDTQADAMIKLMGGINVVDQFSSFKPLTPEGALQTQPDIIVVANSRGDSALLEKFKLLAHTPAAKNNRIIQADSMLLLGFGPRIDKAISAMAPAFYVSR